MIVEASESRNDELIWQKEERRLVFSLWIIAIVGILAAFLML